MIIETQLDGVDKESMSMLHGPMQRRDTASESPNVSTIMNINRYRVTQIIYVVAKLGIADTLVSGAATAEQLAASCQAHPRALYRLLRAAAAIGIFRQTRGGEFENTELSLALASRCEPTLRPYASFLGEDWHWNVWGNILETVKTGAPAFRRVLGYDPHEFTTRDHAAAARFSAAVDAILSLDPSDVMSLYDFSTCHTLLYAGFSGAYSTFLTQFFAIYPKKRAILLVRPEAAIEAEAVLQREGIIDRCLVLGIEPGTRVPEGADVHVFRHLLSHYSDRDARELLRQSYRALPRGGRVLLVGMIVGPANEFGLAKLIDIEGMLMSTDSRERTEGEYEALVAEAGLRVCKVLRNSSPISIIETEGSHDGLSSSRGSPAYKSNFEKVEHRPTVQSVMAQPAVQLSMMMSGFRISRALYVIAALGIPDLLARAAFTTDDLASRTSTHTRSLYRILRAVGSVGYLHEGKDGRFHLTPLGSTLVSQRPDTLLPTALDVGGPAHWEMWGQLLHSVRTGEPAWNRLHRRDFLDSCINDDILARAVNSSKTSIYAPSDDAITTAYDFSTYKSVVEVGLENGYGGLLLKILQKYPSTCGTLYDLSNVILQASTTTGINQCGGRYRLIGGDCRKSVTVQGDLYILKGVLHSLSDDTGISVVNSCRKAIAGRGKLLVCEMIMAPGNDFSVGKLIDVECLLLTPAGRERTEEELRSIIRAGGFRVTRVLSTTAPISIIEATTE
jgi:hypothetical protein